MRITKPVAKRFAEAWLNGWNNKDIEAIMQHYADNIIFSSPFILKANINSTGTIRGKNDLKVYFAQALEKNPDLHFELVDTMVGSNSITLIYKRKGTMLAAEVMLLNEKGEIAEGMSHYPVDTIYDLL